MQMLAKQNSGASTSDLKSEGATRQEQGTAWAQICPADECMWAWACTVPLPGIAPSYWSIDACTDCGLVGCETVHCCLVLAWACQPAVPLEASVVWCSPCVLWYAAYLVMAKVWCCKPATTDQLAFCASQYIHSSELLHLSCYTIRVHRFKNWAT